MQSTLTSRSNLEVLIGVFGSWNWELKFKKKIIPITQVELELSQNYVPHREYYIP